jgi:hypothetical protein
MHGLIFIAGWQEEEQDRGEEANTEQKEDDEKARAEDRAAS